MVIVFACAELKTMKRPMNNIEKTMIFFIIINYLILLKIIDLILIIPNPENQANKKRGALYCTPFGGFLVLAVTATSWSRSTNK
jgi:hypothetical protein